MRKDFCIICDREIEEHEPYESIKIGKFCGDCALKKGIITDKQYVKEYLYFMNIDKIRVCVKDDEIHISTGKFPWEITSRDRDCKEYREWRRAVFRRDNYTCVVCGQVGGVLNAHHIKEYSKYPNLRYEVSNGVTLCEDCHKKEHRRRKYSGRLD